MKKSVILALKLLVICAVATLVLAFTNQETAPIIEQAQKDAEVAAYKEVYPNLEEIQEDTNKDVLNDNIVAVNDAMVDGEVDGYIFTVSSPKGYDGPVTFVVGVKNDGTVTGFKVLQQSETTGIGARVAEKEYADGVSALKLTAPIKSDGAGGTENTIPHMTGATLTSTAMEKAFNKVVEAYGALSGNVVESSSPMNDVTEDQIKEAYDGSSTPEKMEVAPTNEILREVYEVGDGYVFHVTAPDGFHGPIEFLVGVAKDGTIRGFVIVEENETEGFGSVISEKPYADGLKGQKLDSVDATVSGATFTTEGMNEGFEAVQAAFGDLVK